MLIKKSCLFCILICVIYVLVQKIMNSFHHCQQSLKKTKKRVYLAYLQVLSVPVKKNTIFSHSISSLCMKTEKKHFFFAPVDFVFLIWFAIFFFHTKKSCAILAVQGETNFFFFYFFSKMRILNPSR